MIRHIFIATIKNGISEEVVNQKMAEMQDLKNRVPEIAAIMVAKSLGWAGPANTVTMTVDLADRVAFNALMQSPAHQQISARADEAFDTKSFVVSQIEW